MSDVRTMNLSDADDGMVSLNNKPSTDFVPEKNVSEHKDNMDSTPINDIMGQPQEIHEQPMLAVDPRMAHQTLSPTVVGRDAPIAKKSNPMNLTDDQMLALIVVLATGVAVSMPVQEKLAGTVPKFLNAQGNRSMIGLGATGIVAAIIFYFAKKYY